MKIVIDTNVLMAGFLRNSVVREILMSKSIRFFLPDEAIKEVKKYSGYLCKKAGYTKKELNAFLFNLSKNMKIVPKSEIRPYMEKADEIMGEIDINDSPFIATCFVIGADGIWSFDNDFKRQNYVRVFDIKDILGFIQDARK